MNLTSAWNSLELAKFVVSILTPVTVVVLGYLFNKRSRDKEKRDDRIQDDARRHREKEKARREAEEQRRREEKDSQEKAKEEELKRIYKPHIEFDIDCHFFGPLDGKFAAEFLLIANNKGVTRHEFKSIVLRVRGIKNNVPLACWTEKYEHRLNFPISILKDEVKAKKYNYIFVEPGVKQTLSYQTIIDADIRLITARAEFFYDPDKKYTPHSSEKMFEVRSTM